MKNLSRNGFTLIEALLIIIALGVITGVGFYVYNSVRPNEQTTTATTQQATQTATKKYLRIPEAGIKLELTDSIKDAYYVVGDGGYIYLSTRYFDAVPGFEKCKATSEYPTSGVLGLEIAKVGDPSLGGSWTQAELEALDPKPQKIDETYYWLQKGNGTPCWYGTSISENDPRVTKLEQIQSDLIAQIPTISKL
jgi:hypothetical protein